VASTVAGFDSSKLFPTGMFKTNSFSSRVQDTANLKVRVRQEVSSITKDIRRGLMNSFLIRLQQGISEGYSIDGLNF
jgi:hypothetical protein